MAAALQLLSNIFLGFTGTRGTWGGHGLVVEKPPPQWVTSKQYCAD